MNNKKVTLILLVLMLPFISVSQDDSVHKLQYGVYINYPPVSLSSGKLDSAISLIDLNPRYQYSWVREYHSVEIITSQNGMMRKAISHNDTLSREQIVNIRSSDRGTNISVIVDYTPENTLKNNERKQMSFEFRIDPENEATFPGGQSQLNQYLKEKIIDKITNNSFKQYQLAALTFTIDEEGNVMDPMVFWSSDDEKIDALLMQAACSMPTWQPAKHANGKKVKQDFVLTLGDMQSCVVPLLNIRQEDSFWK